MARTGIARAPDSGFGARRGATGLALAACALLAGVPAQGQRIAYPSIPDSGAAIHRVASLSPPRLHYPALPVDDQTALDSDDEKPLSPADMQRLRDRIALAQLSQNYRPTPAIWKIGNRDTTIWLFGTIHVLPPGFNWRSPALDRVVARADALLVEAVDDNAGALSPLMGHEAPAAPAMAPLARRVSPNHRAALRQFTDTLSPPAAATLDALPTWIASVAVGFVRDFQAGEIPGPGADDWLEAHFRAAGKPVIAIEDGEKVMASVAAIPEAEQRRMLDAALDAPPRTRAELRAPTHAWAKGEIGPNSPLIAGLIGTRGTEALAAPLLTDRNLAWADSLAARLKTPGTLLFAAGAGHFIGPGSVIELLQRKGITVTRVQ